MAFKSKAKKVKVVTFISNLKRYNDLKKKGYKTLWVGENRMAMWKGV